jgi:acetoacetyl-CoA synthetase
VSARSRTPTRCRARASFPTRASTSRRTCFETRDDTDAIVFWGEDKVKRRLSHRELYDTVSRVQQALVAAGVKEGDRVAAFMPNMPRR